MSTQALVFTDLVDSTLLVERLGDERALQLWTEHDRRARDLLALHRGREIDRSDGFFLIFDNAVDAAGYALAYHEALGAMALSARVGLHVGDVTLRQNSPEDVARGAKRIEVEGLAKPLAARIMALARGGQTLLSAAARAELLDLPEATEVESHGHYRLKGVEAPVEVFELGLRRACAFEPPRDTDKAYRVVLAGELWQPLREVRHNLSAERDAFVGRATELRAFGQRLDAGARLLSVLGPGGTGKTRFVRRYGLAWLGDWPGGIYFCDLSEARSLDGICFAVAAALEVPLGKDDPVLQLGHAIAGRGRCLVILDNFEQVVEHAAASVGRWADRAARAAFVVTSRERLHLQGEEIFPIEPLGLEREAIDLFAARARAQRPEFVLDAGNRAAVAEVVRLLDGLPLAIELAAARTRVLSPAQLVERMRDRFQLLAGARGAAARQATLKAAIDWSWDLLAPWEQAALAQCSVFEGGFTLEAAEAVLSLAAWPEAPPAMDAIQALVDKSLLRSWVRPEHSRFDIDEPYFGMYVSIHEYAQEKLLAGGTAAQAAAHERHGRHFAGFGTLPALDALHGRDGTRRRRALAPEIDNLVAACRRAVARHDADTAVATYRAAWKVLELRGPFALATELGTQVLALDRVEGAQRAAACVIQALAARRLGRSEDAQAWLSEALALSRAADDRLGEAVAIGNLGNLAILQSRIDEARAHAEAALVIHRSLGNRRGEGGVLGMLAVLHHDRGEMEQALPFYEAGLALHRETGDRLSEGIVLGNLGTLHNDVGRLEEARAHYEETLAICAEVGDRSGEGVTFGNLGKLQLDLGRHDDAIGFYETALTIAREIGGRREEGVVVGQMGQVRQAQGRLGDAQVCYQQALDIAREIGNRRFEGEALGNLGDLFAALGRTTEARDAVLAGEAVLREIGDVLDLARLLCIHGRIELGAGNADAARAVLAEAQAAALALGAEADSALSHDIASLRAALG